MKAFFHKAISASLALLVLLSTVSWTVDKHLCMGRIMDVAFFAPAEDCGMESAMAAFEDGENHCCDDESFTLEGQDDLKLAWNDFDLDDQVFLFALAQSFINPYYELKQRHVANLIYPPPLLVHDYTVMYEVYLI